jgi:SAM-dependent methyltransferase
MAIRQWDMLSPLMPARSDERSDAPHDEPRRYAAAASKTVFGVAIFASAFLLFLIEPLIAKILLPRFGGAAEVWIVCLLFFQVLLLLGYWYADLLARRVPAKMQGRLHAGLLAVSGLSLPVLWRSIWGSSVGGDPVIQILLLLAISIGLPYCLLSSTSPLLQAWYTRERVGAIPYRFYALSNLGSMLALLSYPAIIEPAFRTKLQVIGWSVGYGAIAILCAGVALLGREHSRDVAPGEAAEISTRPSGKTQALWVALAACGSALLLAITNHITQNIAAVPLLWVIPLCLYLLSYILCFERAGWYPRGFFLRLLGVALGAMTYALSPSFASLPITVLLPLYCGGLFVCCMFCHGELARLKPDRSRDPSHLTGFYLMCALGGALGAVFVALIAPHVFRGYYELQVSLAACAVLVLVVNYRDPAGPFYKGRWQPAWIVLVAVAVAIAASLGVTIEEQGKDVQLTLRNFYGVLRVIDTSDTAAPVAEGQNSARYRVLMNGTIKHGMQFLAPELRRRPTSYYGPNSGIGVALESAGRRGPLRVGVIGLGAGTIAAYGRAGDRYTFYEINPLDVEVAKQQFTFLRDSGARIEIMLGDARLSLEREPSQGFDVLVVDAFSGDSIPVHLLTRQAFELYFRHLKADGVLAVHVSNQFLDLQPVVEAAASSLDRQALLISNGDDHPEGIYAANWILVGDSQAFTEQAEMEDAGVQLTPSQNDVLWTDDYSSLFKILK